MTPLPHTTDSAAGIPVVIHNPAPKVNPYHRPNDAEIAVPMGLDEVALVARPSLRTHRRNFTIACTVFSIGFLTIMLGSPWHKEFIAPGPLSSHHAPLAAHESGDRCAACHAAANGSMASWIASFFTSAKSKPISQSELCMKCHKDSFSNSFALNPHNIDPEELAEKTRQTGGQKRLASFVFSPPVNQHNEIACAACHREHHGGLELSRLTDAQCQSCHGNQFHSFEHGHPEFTNYPQQRRSRIAFDHASHFGRHFPEKGKAFDCAQCHIDDNYQNVKRMASFEQSCADCHNSQILDSTSQGLALISLPMLDMQAIETAGLNVGNWPRTATGDFDGPIPPLMRVMLMADAEAAEILSARGPKFEFFDLDAAERNDVVDAVRLAWSIKRLLGDLSDNGPLAMQRRLEKVLGIEISKGELSRVITTLDSSVFKTTATAWLPNLEHELRELEKHNASISDVDVWQALEVAVSLRDTEFASLGEARLHDDTFSPADRPSNAGLEKRLDRNDGRTSAPAILASARSTPPEPDDDLLAVNPLAELMKNRSDQPPVPLVKLPTEPLDELAPAPDNKPPTIRLSEELFDELNRPSGWYRDDRTLQISYRPSGHADPCLKSWIDLVSRIKSANVRPETEQLFETTLAASGIGLCQTCHTVDQQSDQTFLVNWLAEYRDPARRSFTKFSHAPHLIQTELRDCSSCHELDSQRSNTHTFQGFDPNEFISNFRPIVKADCITCHQQGRTNSSCTQCHDYHVGH